LGVRCWVLGTLTKTNIRPNKLSGPSALRPTPNALSFLLPLSARPLAAGSPGSFPPSDVHAEEANLHLEVSHPVPFDVRDNPKRPNEKSGDQERLKPGAACSKFPGKQVKPIILGRPKGASRVRRGHHNRFAPFRNLHSPLIAARMQHIFMAV